MKKIMQQLIGIFVTFKHLHAVIYVPWKCLKDIFMT